MNKKAYFLIAIGLLIAAVPISSSLFHPKKSTPIANAHAEYDEPVNSTSEADMAKVETLKAKENNIVGTQLLQQFKSGQVASINLPADTVATTSALKTNIKGLSVTSEDYYLVLLHVLKLDSASNLCKTLYTKNMHTDMFVKSHTTIPTKKALTSEWDLKNQQGGTLKQVNACYQDGDKKAWIMDIYFPTKKYDQIYKKEVAKLVESFTFTQ